METQKAGARNKQSTDLTLSKLTKWKVGLLRCSYFFTDFLKFAFNFEVLLLEMKLFVVVLNRRTSF